MIDRYGKPQRRSYKGGVDVVINFTGGHTWQPSLRYLKRGGKLLVCGATAGHNPEEDLRYVWTFELKIIGSNSFYDDDLSALMQLISQGKIKPVIDKVLPLEEASEGLAADPGPQVIGNNDCGASGRAEQHAPPEALHSNITELTSVSARKTTRLFLGSTETGK